MGNIKASRPPSNFLNKVHISNAPKMHTPLSLKMFLTPSLIKFLQKGSYKNLNIGPSFFYQSVEMSLGV